MPILVVLSVTGADAVTLMNVICVDILYAELLLTFNAIEKLPTPNV